MNVDLRGNAVVNHRYSLATIKPFRLVRYLSLSSFVAVIVCTLFLSGFISQRVRAVVLQKSEEYALLVAENLNHQVYMRFTYPTFKEEGMIRLSRKHQYQKLDEVVRRAIQGFAIERVNIYDPVQTLTYSTETDKIGTRAELGDSFQQALDGKPASFLVNPKKGLLDFNWSSKGPKIITYYPMWEERRDVWEPNMVFGVFEITQDTTRVYQEINRFQWMLLASFMVFAGILLITLTIIALRAERIITSRAAERRKLEEKLEQSERLAALGEMIAGVSHEIRNPLGIIRSTAELLDSRLENDRQKRFSEIIVQESTRLNAILTEFLDFARPKTLQAALCRLEDVLERNLHVLEPECRKLNVRLERDYQAGDYDLEADADLLYRALTNLLSNALQAMPEGGVLRVRTAVVNGRDVPRLELRIEDTGTGIPTPVLKKIFNPFFTTREQGTGLGLAIVRSIIDSHNGDIEVESGETSGTTVIIRLPLTGPHRTA